jgi:hypothetical protein
LTEQLKGQNGISSIAYSIAKKRFRTAYQKRSMNQSRSANRFKGLLRPTAPKNSVYSMADLFYQAVIPAQID